MKDWIYQNNIFEQPSEDQVGFIYLITNIDSGRKYIGKKIFWNTRRKKSAYFGLRFYREICNATNRDRYFQKTRPRLLG